MTGKADTGRQEAAIGMARVPDARIDALSAMFAPKKDDICPGWKCWIWRGQDRPAPTRRR
ncbi:MAG: hypothetical protein MZU97_27340 [Bacillus subtilis]|nr:hypothetical protein [Bacillus subtilis]